MEIVLIAAVALVASALTLFSGFGLGTLLVPAFALLFPVPLAVAAAAAVHLANNALKVGLLARQADRRTVLHFGVPAAGAAIAGAALLGAFDRVPALLTYALGEGSHEVTLVKLVIGALIAGFALLELSPRFQLLALDPRWLPLGGALSGFFGGLSGNQGALRSAFLLKAGLSKDAFVATGVVSAVIVDVVRVAVYGHGLVADSLLQSPQVLRSVAIATAFAFAGTLAGRRLLHAATWTAVRWTVVVAMLAVGVGLMLGLI